MSMSWRVAASFWRGASVAIRVTPTPRPQQEAVAPAERTSTVDLRILAQQASQKRRDLARRIDLWHAEIDRLDGAGPALPRGQRGHTAAVVAEYESSITAAEAEMRRLSEDRAVLLDLIRQRERTEGAAGNPLVTALGGDPTAAQAAINAMRDREARWEVVREMAKEVWGSPGSHVDETVPEARGAEIPRPWPGVVRDPPWTDRPNADR